MKTYALTDIGLERRSNQDRYLIKEISETELLLAVADGMGGTAGGDIAATAVKDALAAFTPVTESPEQELRVLIRKLSDKLLALARKEEILFSMGTTVTAVVLVGSQAHWVHVGDSRLYHLTGTTLIQITTDQNWAQSLVDYGDMTPEEARISPMRHMLAECVGCPDCQSLTGTFGVKTGDSLFLCTDGVHGYLEPDDFKARLTRQASLEVKLDDVIKGVLDAGGHDNATIIGVEI